MIEQIALWQGDRRKDNGRRNSQQPMSGCRQCDSAPFGHHGQWFHPQRRRQHRQAGERRQQHDRSLRHAGNVRATVFVVRTINRLKYHPVSKQIFAPGRQLLPVSDRSSTNAASVPPSSCSGYVYGANSDHGFDDVAFVGGKVFESATNPTTLSDPIVDMLDSINNPSGTLNTRSGFAQDVVGRFALTSDHDASLTIIRHPGTSRQSASFVTFPAGSSGLDDAIIPTATSGTFIISNAGAEGRRNRPAHERHLCGGRERQRD